MKFEDFKIGEYFYSRAGKWLVVDKGTKTIIAAKTKYRINGILEDPYFAHERRAILVEDYESLDLEVWTEIDFGGCDLIDRFKDV